MIVPVITVNVCCHNHLKPIKQFCRFQANAVYLFGCSIAIGLKGLHILFEEHTLCFAVLMLGSHKLLIRRFWNAVLTAYKFYSVNNGFFVLHNIIKHSFHRRGGLRLFRDCRKNCHQPHLLTISLSVVSTSAYCRFNSCKSGQIILPILQSVVS